MVKATTKRQRRALTPEFLDEIRKLGDEHGTEAIAKKYGYTNGYAVSLYVRSRAGQVAKDATASTAQRIAGTKRTRVVADYLNECREASFGGGGVSLGALKGFPAKTSDPEVVDRAADYYANTVIPNASTVVQELKARQRLMDLRYHAERLRYLANGQSSRKEFVKVAAEWAADNGITYAAFRDMGVSAAVLREAGIVP